MEQQIAGAIIRSSGSVMRNIANDELVDESVKTFPIVDKDTVSQLAASLTDLLSYRVSPEAYQRYAARLQIIDTLRDWVRLPLGLDTRQVFFQEENYTNFLKTTIRKNLHKNTIDNLNTNSDKIIPLSKSLVNLGKLNSFYIPQLKKLIKNILDKKLPLNDDLLDILLKNRESLQLDFSLFEKLYISNAEKFIEEPLIDFFILNLNNIIEKKELIESPEFKNLLDLIAKSSKIFSVVSGILGRVFLHLDRSLAVITFTQYVLTQLAIIIDKSAVNLIDLYPIKLRSCVILMRIEPKFHTENSKSCLLEMLKKIYDDNCLEALVLLMHYPNWLDDFNSFMINDCN